VVQEMVLLEARETMDARALMGRGVARRKGIWAGDGTRTLGCLAPIGRENTLRWLPVTKALPVSGRSGARQSENSKDVCIIPS